MPAATIPFVMRALIIQGKSAVIVERPTPTLIDDEVLVKVKTASLNPVDWKQIKIGWGTQGAILGCDVAGEIVQIGPNTISQPSLRIGDRVVGLVYGGNYPDRGAFAEYAKIYSGNVWKIPEGAKYEDAVTIGVSCVTPAQVLFAYDRLALVESPNKVHGNSWVFIYGGGTCCGYFAIQWAKLAGYRVATVSSPRNFALMKSAGADVVFDYNDPHMISKIKHATGDSIHKAFDSFGSPDSQVITVKVLAPGKGHVIVNLPTSQEALRLRKDVIVQTNWLYSSSGVEFNFGGVVISPSDVHKAQIVDLCVNKLSLYYKEGKLRPTIVKLWPGGLDSIPIAMDYMAGGYVSAEKVVFPISE